MWLLLLACSGAEAPSETVQPAAGLAEAPPAPDVVLVVIDTLRVDRLGLRGASPSPSPWIDGLEGTAAVFDRAWSSSSWTAPSTATVFTGLYPTQHGVIRGLVATQELEEAAQEGGAGITQVNRMPAGLRTLPELMQAAGYRTMGLASNINIGEDIGFTRGFDRFEYAPGATARDLAGLAVAWSREPHPGPDFLYLHLNDVHSPYLAREPWYAPQGDPQADLLATYDSGISYVDQYLARLDTALNWDENTVLIVVSDHGEEFGDHGQQGHLFSLHRELTQALFVVRAPGVAPGRRGDTVSLIDVLPTALQLAGLTPPEDREGLSLAPLLREGQGLPGERTVFSHRVNGEEELWSAQAGDWRIIWSPEDVALYDLAEDPGERRSVGAEHPMESEDLGSALAGFRARAGEARSEMGTTELDAAELEALRSLGYVETP